jgi:hypothetical protein
MLGNVDPFRRQQVIDDQELTRGRFKKFFRQVAADKTGAPDDQDFGIRKFVQTVLQVLV